MRILMIAPTSFFADYGCHVRILEEARALQSRGHRVRICTYHNGSDLPGLDIHRSVDVPWLKRAEVGSSRHKAYLDAALSLESLRQAIAFRPHLIHGHLHEGALIGSTIGRMTRTPVVFDYQGSLTEEMLDHGFIRQRGRRERFFRLLERRIDRMPAAVIVSGVAGERFLHRSGLGNEHVTLIHDGVDTLRFDPSRYAAERIGLRHRMGIPDDAPVVVYLGLLAEYQGTSLLIEAARRLLQRRPEMYFVVAGYPAADYYADFADKLGIGQRVLFPGRVAYEDAPRMLMVGDVAVAPKLSSTESNGKLLNYMAMGLPTAAIDTPTNRTILGGMGHLAQPNDPDSLVAALEAALLDPDDIRRALRQRIVAHYSWSDRVRDIERVYDRVLGRSAVVSLVTADQPAPSSD